MLSGRELDTLLGAIGDFADLKCPFTVGHSRAVAELAGSAAMRMGLASSGVDVVRRAALVHDLGRMGVPNSVWERSAPLSESDRDRIRLYPYLTGRVLHRVAGLESVTAVAEAHRERLDGSGYPRGLKAAELPITQRVLAAADSYRGSLEHRLTEGGRLDPTAVEAVLSVAGHRSRRRTAGPAGLTGREVEVLGMLSQGLSTNDIAQRLFISVKTVRNHLEHIYLKVGVSNRTGAMLFALEKGIAGTKDEAPAP